MSKIVDLAENFDIMTKEHLANTYVLGHYNNPSKNKNEEIAVLSGRKSVFRKRAFMQFFPWFVSILAILLLLINIVYRGKIAIKIEFLSGDTAKTMSESAKIEMLAKKIKLPSTAPAASSTLTNLLVLNGEINEHLIKKAGFYGAAGQSSKILKDGICLINDGTAGWASAGFDLISPADLTTGSLDFFAKGADGKESLQVILRDADNNSYIPQAQNLIFDKNMDSEWQFVSIPFNSLKGYYNPKRICHIGFEFGTQTTQNEPGACIYIKNIEIVSR